MNKYFSTHEVAQLCQVSRGSVIRWINEGKLPAATTVGGHNRIHAADVEKLLLELRLPVPQGLKNESPGALKALLVDDEVSFLNVLHQFLKNELPDLEVTCAVDGFEAGMLIEKEKPDLVVLDLFLPGMNGFHICELIRKNPSLAKTKILAISGMAESSQETKILSLGADDFLAKPFKLEDFKALIQKHLLKEKGGSP